MKTKMLALFAALVLSVALAGTAYATWTTQITFTGSVSTGNIAVQITSVTTASPEIDVDFDDDSFAIAVDNVYPGWTGSVTITVLNSGSLPVSIDTPSVTIVSDPNGLDQYLDISTSSITPSFASGDSVTVTVTLIVDDVAEVPQSATATYSGSVTFNGP
jgi:hypothetical protein